MTPVVVSPKADADVDLMLELLGDLAGPAVVGALTIVGVLDGRRNLTRRLVRE